MFDFNTSASRLAIGKLGLVVLMFLLSTMACFIPACIYWITKRKNKSASTKDMESSSNSCLTFMLTVDQQQNLLGIANCLAAGSLLSVGFLDILTDTIEIVEKAKSAISIETNFPIATFLVLIGFFLILGIELVVMEMCSRRHPHNSTNDNNRFHSALAKDQKPNAQHSSLPSCSTMKQLSEIIVSTESQDTLNKASGEGFDSNTFSFFTLLFTLAFHSVFEGLVLGLSKSIRLLFTLFGVLIIHKIIVALSIGMNFLVQLQKYMANSKTKGLIFQIIAIAIFSGSSPLGILIGWSIAFKDNKPTFLVTQAILQGLSCGIFLYIVFCELMPNEFKECNKNKLGKFVCLVCGFLIVALIIFLSPDDD